jgi:hypothetical protein
MKYMPLPDSSASRRFPALNLGVIVDLSSGGVRPDRFRGGMSISLVVIGLTRGKYLAVTRDDSPVILAATSAMYLEFHERLLSTGFCPPTTQETLNIIARLPVERFPILLGSRLSL